MPFRFRPSRCLLVVLSSLGLVTGSPGVAQDLPRLPELGSSADALVAPQQAELWGQAMFRQMRRMGLLLDDPLLDDRLNGLGHRLAAASDRPTGHFRFLLVKDPEINAFAAPGGYIAVNSGLILLSRNRDELASVLAHEIGHITQDHLQRSFEQARHATPLLGLVMLGAVAAGAAGAGDAGIATLAGGQGLLLQRSINFTRADEAEADQVGIQTLARAGFDPDAMAEFFGRLGDQLRTGGSERSVPGLLQDHPVTSRRIADAKAAAAIIRRHPPPSMPSASWSLPWTINPSSGQGPAARPSTATAADQDDEQDYLLLRERVRVLSGRSAALDRYYRPRLRAAVVTPADAYGAALNLTREGLGHRALDWLLPLRQRDPDNLIINLAVAAARLQAGQRAAALAMYASLHRDHPVSQAVTLAYARALLGASPQQARMASAMLRPLLVGSDDPAWYSLYARSCEQADEPVRAGEADAAASYYAGRPFDAIQQFRRLLDRGDLDYYARARIQAQVSQLTPLVLELRRQHIVTDDDPGMAASP